jgi:hypothetical protein
MGELVSTIMETFEGEATLILDLAKSMQKLKREKLDTFLQTAGQDLKQENDTDDNNWKQLCDAARLESRVAARYRQTRLQHEKARERIHSMDTSFSEDGSEGRAGAKSQDGADAANPQNRMSMALFAGGEAMKKLQGNAKLAIAKNNLSEADYKVGKEQQALDEATAAKNRAITAYKRVTETRVEKFESSDKQRMEDFKEIFDTLMKGIDALGKARHEGLEKPWAGGKTTYSSLMNDVEEWVQTAIKEVQDSQANTSNDEAGAPKEKSSSAAPEDGFQLRVVLVQSESIDKLLELERAEEPIPEFLRELDEAASRHIGGEEHKMDDGAGDKRSQTLNDENKPDTPLRLLRKSLRKSITTLEGSDALRSTPSVVKQADSYPEVDADNMGTEKQVSPEMQAYIQQFWSDKTGGEKPAEVLNIFNCAYRPKEKGAFLTPNLHGRIYTTVDDIYFLAWDGKNFIISWKNIISVRVEKGFMGANDNGVLVTYQSEGSEMILIFSRLEARDSVLQRLQKLHEDSKARKVPPTSEAGTLAPVPPDTVLKGMTVVLLKTIKNASIKRVYESVWSDGIGTSAAPFYKPWLEEEKCFEITVNDWEFADEGYTNPWCNERYTQRRLVTFRFNRTSHLYIGPPVAFVKQMQYCKVEGNDKCVLAISATFEGIPYADTFAVEMRWVGIRKGTKDVQVEVALHVDFKKSTMLKSQIKSGTISETKNVHLRLFEAARKVCSTPGQTPEEPEEEEEGTEEEEGVAEEQEFEAAPLAKLQNMLGDLPVDKKIVLFAAAVVAFTLVGKSFSYFFGSRYAPVMSSYDDEYLGRRIDEIQDEVRALQRSVDLVIELLKEKN